MAEDTTTSQKELVENVFVRVTMIWHPISDDQLESLKQGVRESTISYSAASLFLTLAASKWFDASLAGTITLSLDAKWGIGVCAAIGLVAGIYGIIKTMARRRVIEAIKSRGSKSAKAVAN